MTDPNGTNGNGWHAGEAWPGSGVGSSQPTITKREAGPKRALATVGFLLDATRRRRAGRIGLWAVVLALGIGGMTLIFQPLITDVWARKIQSGLGKEFAAASAEDARAAFRQRTVVPEGKALTKLRIPKLHVNKIVVQGTSGNALRAGLGHYPDSALPGDATGNVSIAGHRTGFGEPFRHLERLREGDRIELVTPFSTFVYQVMGPFDGHTNPWITHAKDWTVIAATPIPSLTLTTCDPPGTSKNRLIVRARLIGSQPAG